MGKVALIAGGSSGIGLALAEILVQDHFSVSIIARDKDRLIQASERLKSLAPEDASVAWYSADVTDRAATLQGIDDTINKFGKIDWLVFSAGMSRPGYLEEQDEQIFRDTFEVNLFAAVETVRMVLPAMKQRKSGNIVLIASGAAIFGVFGSSSYSASKFALGGFAEVLRAECIPHNIKVSVAFPPDTDTPMHWKNEKYKPRELKIISAAGGIHSAKKVASNIYRGVRRGDFAITTGFRMFLAKRLKSLLYPIVFRRWDAKVRRKMN